MKPLLILSLFLCYFCVTKAQEASLKIIRENSATAIKNQGQTGTCWDYSTTSLVESESIRKGLLNNPDLSEMFTVRNVYIEKAKNYVLRQGKAQFSEGGLGHDLIQAIAKYGAVPQNVFHNVSGEVPNHEGLDKILKDYLDKVLNNRPIPTDWLIGYEKILTEKIGTAPDNFDYEGKNYTPRTFATEVLKFDPNDYVNITSFTHHPFYAPFVLETPDNFANASFYNVPLNEMISLTEEALKNGYTIMWDADVSNKNFQQKKGFALLFADSTDAKQMHINPEAGERTFSENVRQQLYENLTTQDDHLMHLVGIEQSKGGKSFFKVKNSWGEVGPFKGYISVSSPYFAINTVSLVVPKDALSKEMKEKLKLL